MRLTSKPLSIGDEEGFSQEKDIFNRRPFGEGMLNLMSVAEEPLVVLLDGPWGTGKTTFIKMWAGLLRTSGFPVILFDAFKNDYSNDAFLALAGEILALAHERLGNDSKRVQLVKRTKEVAKVLLGSATKVAVKAATAGILGAADFEGIGKDIAAAASGEVEEIADKYITEVLEKHEKDKAIFAQFADALSLLAKDLGSGSDESNPRKLIFIVDELDRCRPSFALEVLERVKHFFQVDGVHFIIVTQSSQLESAVCHAYGQATNARTYLEKFYTLRIQMPVSLEEAREDNPEKYLRHLLLDVSESKFDARLIQLTNDFIACATKVNSCSFRTIEQIVSHLRLCMAFGNTYTWIPPIVGGLCVVKAIRPDLYTKAQRGSLKYDDIIDVFGFRNADAGKGDTKFFRDWWLYCTREDLPSNGSYRGFDDAILKYNLDDRRQLVPFVANTITDVIQKA